MSESNDDFKLPELSEETGETATVSNRIGSLEGRVLIVIGMTILASVLMLLLLFSGADGFRPGTGVYPPENAIGSDTAGDETPGSDTSGNRENGETRETEGDTPVYDPFPYATVCGMESVLPVRRGETGTVDGVISGHYILVDASDLSILEAAGENERIDPASMTKVMTLLVLCDRIRALDETVTIPRTLLNDPILSNDVQIIMDFIHDDHDAKELPVEVLMYMIGVESSADAVLALTRSLAGNDATFVGWMNDKAAELGLKDTHFTNAIGLKQPDHYSTVSDMAAIMIYALQNPLCRQILGTVSYPYFDEGAGMRETLYSTLFVDRMEKKKLTPRVGGGITIGGGKTGSESYADGEVWRVVYTLMTYASDSSGNTYVAVTAMDVPYDTVADPMAQTVKDAIALYKTLIP